MSLITVNIIKIRSKIAKIGTLKIQNRKILTPLIIVTDYVVSTVAGNQFIRPISRITIDRGDHEVATYMFLIWWL